VTDGVCLNRANPLGETVTLSGLGADAGFTRGWKTSCRADFI